MDFTEEVKETIEKELGELQKFTCTPGKGVTRLPFSKEGKETASYLKVKMQEAGLNAWIDLVGNVRGILPADCDDAKTILMGSHYDTVKNGGAYDGIAGVVCALEIVKLLKKSGIRRNYNLEIIAFNDEEGCMFGSGCLGSKSLTGQIDQHYIEHLVDENGISIEEWMKSWGGNPHELEKQKMDLNQVRAFFEIHIEQGPVLYEKKDDLGIVTGIVGLLRCMVTLEGRADHAGTTPMDMRQDTINIASKVISKLDVFAEEENNGAVATCGFIRAYPNAMNVIASKTEFTMDIRSISDVSIEHMKAKIQELLEQYTKECGASYNIDIKLRQPAVKMNQVFVKRLAKKCEDHGYNYSKMVSGAAHDAMVFADKVDTVMVFVPSINGRSHCPEELSRPEDLAKAVQIVYETILELMLEVAL